MSGFRQGQLAGSPVENECACRLLKLDTAFEIVGREIPSAFAAALNDPSSAIRAKIASASKSGKRSVMKWNQSVAIISIY
ncbi:hypothetical protein [Asaia prunellae]|nr:hypothetical protein [Asaia prunellae]